jgi:hypothetical protein
MDQSRRGIEPDADLPQAVRLVVRGGVQPQTG